MPYAQIGRKYAKQISRADSHRYVSEHAKHVGKLPAHRQPIPGTVAEEREVRHRKTVEERQDQIYDTAFDLIKQAAEKGDIRGAASCLAQAANVTAQMKGSEPDKNNAPKESAFWKAYGERAKVVFDGQQT